MPAGFYPLPFARQSSAGSNHLLDNFHGAIAAREERGRYEQMLAQQLMEFEAQQKNKEAELKNEEMRARSDKARTDIMQQQLDIAKQQLDLQNKEREADLTDTKMGTFIEGQEFFGKLMRNQYGIMAGLAKAAEKNPEIRKQLVKLPDGQSREIGVLIDGFNANMEQADNAMRTQKQWELDKIITTQTAQAARQMAVDKHEYGLQKALDDRKLELAKEVEVGIDSSITDTEYYRIVDGRSAPRNDKIAGDISRLANVQNDIIINPETAANMRNTAGVSPLVRQISNILNDPKYADEIPQDHLGAVISKFLAGPSKVFEFNDIAKATESIQREIMRLVRASDPRPSDRDIELVLSSMVRRGLTYQEAEVRLDNITNEVLQPIEIELPGIGQHQFRRAFPFLSDFILYIADTNPDVFINYPTSAYLVGLGERPKAPQIQSFDKESFNNAYQVITGNPYQDLSDNALQQPSITVDDIPEYLNRSGYDPNMPMQEAIKMLMDNGVEVRGGAR